jgi:uncharacterized protein YrrD
VCAGVRKEDEMLHNVKDLSGFRVGARDGELGKVKDVYFDDERWAIRHLVVATGGWLSERRVLISPRSVRGIDWNDEVVEVDLTQQQVRDSPGIDTDKPVSRQHEIDYYNYYGYPYYWEGNGLWGPTMLPYPWVGASAEPLIASQQPIDPEVAREIEGRIDEERDTQDVHLRSCDEVIGYDILATDGSFGEVDNFLFDDESWAIRFLVVDTRKWLPGKHVRIAPEHIDHVSWEDHEVDVKMTRAEIENSPEYDPSSPLPATTPAPLRNDATPIP